MATPPSASSSVRSIISLSNSDLTALSSLSGRTVVSAHPDDVSLDDAEVAALQAVGTPPLVTGFELPRTPPPASDPQLPDDAPPASQDVPAPDPVAASDAPAPDPVASEGPAERRSPRPLVSATPGSPRGPSRPPPSPRTSPSNAAAHPVIVVHEGREAKFRPPARSTLHDVAQLCSQVWRQALGGSSTDEFQFYEARPADAPADEPLTFLPLNTPVEVAPPRLVLQMVGAASLTAQLEAQIAQLQAALREQKTAYEDKIRAYEEELELDKVRPQGRRPTLTDDVALDDQSKKCKQVIQTALGTFTRSTDEVFERLRFLFLLDDFDPDASEPAHLAMGSERNASRQIDSLVSSLQIQCRALSRRVDTTLARVTYLLDHHAKARRNAALEHRDQVKWLEYRLSSTEDMLQKESERRKNAEAMLSKASSSSGSKMPKLDWRKSRAIIETPLSTGSSSSSLVGDSATGGGSGSGHSEASLVKVVPDSENRDEMLKYFRTLFHQECEMRVAVEEKLKDAQQEIVKLRFRRSTMDEETANRVITNWIHCLRTRRNFRAIVKAYAEHPHSKPIRRWLATRKELISTERTYVRHLTVLVEDFMPLLQRMSFLPAGTVPAVFSNIGPILDCNKTLLSDLCDAESSWPQEPFALGDIFLKHVTEMKLYTQYINNYDYAARTLASVVHKYQQKHASLAALLQKLETDTKLPLLSYLIMPVQRIPRYVMLLEDLVKATDPEHAEYAKLVEALKAVRDLADHCNESKRDAENVALVHKIQNTIAGNDPSAVPLGKSAARRYVIQGHAMVMGDGTPAEMHCFLFTDVLVFSIIGDKGKHKYRGAFPLSLLAVNRDDDMSPSLTLSATPACMITVWFETMDMTAEWEAALQTSVDRLRQRMADGDLPDHLWESVVYPLAKPSRNRRSSSGVAPSSEEDSELHRACFFGKTSQVLSLLQQGADIDARANFGETPLYVAVAARREKIVRILLDNSANVHIKASNGQTPLDAAVSLGFTAIADLITARGNAAASTAPGEASSGQGSPHSPRSPRSPGTTSPPARSPPTVPGAPAAEPDKMELADAQPPSPRAPPLSGWLQKRGDKGPARIYKKRWFVLQPESRRLVYFKSNKAEQKRCATRRQRATAACRRSGG